MYKSNFKLFSLIFVLFVFQLIFNSLTLFYTDSLGIILVILLFRKYVHLRLIIFLALFADLMGHWYLGSHLFAVILLSFLSQRLIVMYYLAGPLQKVAMVSVFYSMLALILMLIGSLMHNISINWANFGIDVLIFCPVILWLFSFIHIPEHRTDLIF